MQPPSVLFFMIAERGAYGAGASCTVQPEGMPLAPDPQLDIDAALVNVPVVATLLSQFSVQSVAEMSVARQVTLFRLVQPENIS